MGIILGLFAASALSAPLQKDIVARLDEMLIRLDSIHSEQDSLKTLLAETRADIDSITVIIDSLNLRIARSKRRLKGVIRNMYVNGEIPEEMLLLDAKSSTESIREGVYLACVARRRRAVISLFSARQDSAVKALSEKTVLAERTDIILTQLSQTEDSLSFAIKKHRSLLASIRRDRTSYKKALNALADSDRKISLSMNTAGGHLPPLHKPLIWPCNSRKLLHRFGLCKDRRFGTAFQNPGIDIRADAGDIVRSVAAGVVEKISWLRGYERIVVIRHGGGYFTLYSNIRNLKVKEGVLVNKGTPIGTVSPYGWLEGAKLHFEIRKGKQKFDPIKWLMQKAT